MKRAVSLAAAFVSLAALSLAGTGADTAQPFHPGDPAPAFMLKTLDGQEFYLKDYCGKPRGPRTRQERNIVVLSFFNAECKYCKVEIPVLHDVAKKYGDFGVRFFLADIKDSRDTVAAIVADRTYSLPVLLDEYEVVAKKYKIKALPVLVVIDREGRIAEYHTGYLPGYKQDLEKLLKKLALKRMTGSGS